jgi:CheY-like chemotaxis protein
MNLKVDVAQNGEEVLWLVRKFAFDLILLDIDMPLMDGLATAARIRELEKDGQRRTPIIVVSGYLMEAASTSDLRRLFDGAVAKPITLARLWSAMAGVLPEGQLNSARPSVLRAAHAEVPLVNLADLRETQSGESPIVSTAALDQVVCELRKLASALERSMSDAVCDEMLRSTAGELDRLSTRVGATRLQRRASTLAAMPTGTSDDEIRAQVKDVISCAVATIGEFKKLASMSS